MQAPPEDLSRYSWKCSKGHKNDAWSRFCTECGEKRPDLVKCPNGHEMLPFYRYCTECGLPLVLQPPPLPPSSENYVNRIEESLVGRAVRDIGFGEEKPLGPAKEGIVVEERSADGEVIEEYRIMSILGYNPDLSTVTALAVDRYGKNWVLKLLSHDVIREERAGKTFYGVKRRTTMKGVERFESYKRAAKMQHQNLAKVVKALENEKAVVMEFYSGGSLRTAHIPGEKELLEVLLPVLHALIKLHEKKLVHGDVKPENILFTSDGIPKLLDFGALDDIDKPLRMHTPGYTPPKEEKLSPWIDAYAVARIIEENRSIVSPELIQIAEKTFKGEIRDCEALLIELAKYYFTKHHDQRA